jgi:hypothetical protein
MAEEPRMPEQKPQPQYEAPRVEPRKPLFTPQAADPVQAMPDDEDEDELDIPAFIRKKM